jgi:hypothetical protein
MVKLMKQIKNLYDPVSFLNSARMGCFSWADDGIEWNHESVQISLMTKR